jgi:hypothetical protein
VPTRYLLTALLALPICVVASSTSARIAHDAVNASSRLRVYGGRTPEPHHDGVTDKLDAALVDLSRHVSRVRVGHALADLHNLNPALHLRQGSFDPGPAVLVDAITRTDPQALRSALEALGLQGASVYANDVGGWLPVSQLTAAAGRSELHAMRAAISRTRSGAVTSQGDFAQGSQQLRTVMPGLSGAGVTVGVLSNSFNCYGVYEQPGSGVSASGFNGYAPNGFLADAAKDISTGDLPSGVRILEEGPCLDYGAPTQLPQTDEGRAMLQIVHDVAPGASLAFHTAASSLADFASGITALAAAGATVEADDVGYFNEPFFQDGIVAQAIDAVEAQGVGYFSAAGNDATNSYEISSPSFATLSNSGPTAGERLLSFTGVAAPDTTALSVTLPSLRPGDFIGIILEWDQPFVTGAAGSPGASSHLDLCISAALGSDEILGSDDTAITCTGPNATGADAVQLLVIGPPASATGDSAATTINISIGLADGTSPPGRIKLAVSDDGAGAVIDPDYATNSATIQGHPGAAGAVAVGAAYFFDTPACGSSPPLLEPYSSVGGTPILFDRAGNAQTPVIRQKPELVAPDGGNDTFLGYVSDTPPTDINQCQSDSSFPNFFGTSAATPHAAAVAALMRQANAALTPTQLYTALEFTAIPMGSPKPNVRAGYGLIQAQDAVATLPPGVPTLSAAPMSMVVGSAITLTWSSLNTTGCTAAGGWSGALSSAGKQMVTPVAVGAATFTLTCSNDVGSEATAVTVNVVAPAAHSSGGGALDALSVLWLASAWALRQILSRRAPNEHRLCV